MASKSNLKLKDYLSEDGKLDLSILNLKSVPNVNDILALRKVKSIDLSNNQIESLPACISVREYHMKNNVFSFVSQEDFVKLEGIHTLDLSRNRLTKLPDNFGQLKSLKQLDLYDNRISDLPLSFCDLTKLDYLDLKGNPLDADLQIQAGKCLNKKECRSCAEKVLKYMETRKEEFDKEEAIRLKKKQANEKAKAKKREKQAEKEREEKRLKRQEIAQKRLLEREQRKKEANEQEDQKENVQDEITSANQDNDQEEGIISQIIDGVLNSLLLSLMTFFTWQLYRNHRQPMNLQDFYKYV